MWSQYLTPSTVEETVRILDQADKKAIIIAGGTDLLPQYRDGKRDIPALVDITGISELNGIREQNGEILLGGAVTHAQVARSPLIRAAGVALAQGSGVVGSPQIRNQATLSGNIVNAQPAADGAIALIALDARARIVSREGTRTVPVAELYEGVGQSRVDSTHELIEQLSFRALDPKRGEGSAVERLALRRALSLPMVNVAVSLRLEGEHLVWLRIAIGPVATTPYRPFALEKQAHGMLVTEKNIRELAEVCGHEVNPRSSRLRGSSDYRRAMTAVLVRRALLRALNEIRNAGEKTQWNN